MIVIEGDMERGFPFFAVFTAIILIIIVVGATITTIIIT